MKLKDVKVLVTGGSRGLGLAICERFENEGAQVNSVSKSTGYDVSSSERMGILAAQTKPDVLVCCAGVYGPIGPLETNTIRAWRECIEVNLMGVMNCCHKFIPEMKMGGGKIIIISGGGATRARANFSAYAASKAAVVRLMECLADELKPHGIDVNCLAPGALNTSIHDAVIRAGGALAGEEEYHSARAIKECAADFSKATDLAVWLASKESDGTTGKLISIHHDYRTQPA